MLHLKSWDDFPVGWHDVWVKCMIAMHKRKPTKRPSIDFHTKITLNVLSVKTRWSNTISLVTNERGKENVFQNPFVSYQCHRLSKKMKPTSGKPLMLTQLKIQEVLPNMRTSYMAFCLRFLNLRFRLTFAELRIAQSDLCLTLQMSQTNPEPLATMFDIVGCALCIKTQTVNQPLPN